jgi:hypothetical protein
MEGPKLISAVSFDMSRATYDKPLMVTAHAKRQLGLRRMYSLHLGQIREIGNDANHEIFNTGETDAKAAVDFAAMLLKLLYEFRPRAILPLRRGPRRMQHPSS